jgi:DNA polymerase III subunit gamma/tau
MHTMAGDAPGTVHENPARAGGPSPPAPLALYRKYRPATFAEVKGQEHVTEPLRQALRNGRVHHAYLFSGPRGCGKTSSARILARSLNCEQGPTPDPCGVCASCVALAPSGPGSIDVIEIDAASHGGVDDARDLRERAFYAPVSGRFKIYIIDEAHMVTREGFNALLKLVEEPPPHLKFVFATTEPEKVIATIRSRTHHYPFRLVPPAVLRELLEEVLAAEGVSYQPAVLPLVVRAGAGSVRDALSILDQLLAGSGPEGLTYDRTVALLGYTDDSLLDEMVDAFASGNGAAVFGTVDRVVEGGHDPRRFTADLLDRLRDLIILAAVPGAGQSGLLDAPADRLERMAEQAGRFGQAELTRAAEIISEGLIQMRGTASPRLLLELTCAQVLLPAASTGEKALLARLERLEHQLAAVEPAGPRPAAGGPAGVGPAAAGPAGPRPADAQPAGAGPGSRTGPDRAAPSGTTRSRGEPVHDEPSRGKRPRDERPGSERSHDEGSRDAATHDEPAHDERPRPSGGPGGEARRDRSPRSTAAADTTPESGPAAPGAAAPASPRGVGPVDADTLRQRWPEILGAVRGESKVAWILLSNASVESFEGGLLTVAFPREGEARGFAGSGHDQVLIGTLAAMMGVTVRIRAVASGPGGPAGPGGPGAPASPSAGPSSAGRPAPGASAAPDDPPTAEGAPAPGGGRGSSRGAGPGQDAGSPPSAPDNGSPGRSAGNARAAPGERPARRVGSAQSPGGQPGRRGQRGAAPSRPQAAPAEEQWPDDATGPGADLSGMELIRRQLGGRVIEEIDDS